MSSEEELQEAEEQLKAAEPSQGLKNQIRGDDEIQWVARQDLRTAWFNLILHKIKFTAFMLIFGFVAAIFVLGATDSGALGLLAFLVVGLGIPGGWFAWKYYYLKNTIIEYTGTNERFLKYRDTPTETSTRSVPIDRTRDAIFSQDRWDKLLGTGDIRIQSVRGADNIRINDIPQADAVLRLVQDQIAEAEQVDNVSGLRQGGVQQGSLRR